MVKSGQRGLEPLSFKGAYLSCSLLLCYSTRLSQLFGTVQTYPRPPYQKLFHSHISIYLIC